MTGTETAPTSGGYTLLHDSRAAAKFQRTYPGDPSQVRQVREDITLVFGWCLMAEELILVASELATNAIKHTKSGNGGQFTVTVRIRYGDYAWIGVKDQGGKPALRGPDGQDDPQAAHNADRSLGKGLAIVRALAGEGNWGLSPLSQASPSGNLHPEQNAPRHMAWARIPWLSTPQDPLTQASTADGAASRASHAHWPPRSGNYHRGRPGHVSPGHSPLA